MAEVTGFTLHLTVDEIRATHYALGTLSSSCYKTMALANAGSDVYKMLTPFADEENWE